MAHAATSTRCAASWPRRAAARSGAGWRGSTRRRSSELLAASEADATHAERLYEETEGLPFLLVEYLGALRDAPPGRVRARPGLPAGARELLRARLDAGLGDRPPGARRGGGDRPLVRGRHRPRRQRPRRRGDGRRARGARRPRPRARGRGGLRLRPRAAAHAGLRGDEPRPPAPAARPRRRRAGARRRRRAPPPPRATSRSPGRDAEAAAAHVRAAEHARALYANAQALEHLEAALALGHPDRPRCTPQRGDLQTLLGDYGAALAELRGRPPARAPRTPRASSTASAGCTTAAATARSPRRTCAPRSTRERRRRARAESSPTSASSPTTAATRQRAAELAEQALDAGRARRRSARAGAGRTTCSACWPPAGRPEALEHLERSLELAEETGDLGARVAALNNLALAQRARGEHGRAIELTREALALCAAQGDRHREAALRNNLADLLHAAGRATTRWPSSSAPWRCSPRSAGTSRAPRCGSSRAGEAGRRPRGAGRARGAAARGGAPRTVRAGARPRRRRALPGHLGRGSGVPGTEGAAPAPVVYGRAAGPWVQYWLYFTANPQDRGIVRSGRHEGDWEMVQYRIDGGRAVEAVYAQHAGAERCAYDEVEQRGGRPVVYLANGSHAAYFHAGTRDRMWPDPNDEADGRGEVQRPGVVEIGEGAPAWMRRREPWGDARAGWAPFEQSSPPGPAFQHQGRWSDPAAWARRANPCTGRRCVEVGACDRKENALAAAAVAPLALLTLFGLPPPSRLGLGRRGGLGLVPGRENPRPGRGDRDRELEVRGERAVLGVDRPPVVAHPHLVAPGVDHRLDGQHHPLLQRHALAGRAEVGDLRLLVHRAPDPVAHQRAHDREPLGLDVLLDRVGDVAEPVPDPALLHRREQRAGGDLQQLRGDRRDLADRERPRRVGHPAVVDDADVHRQYVAAL